MIAWQRLSWWSWRGLWRAVPPDSSSMSLGNQPFSWEVFTVTARCGCLAAAFLRGCQSPQTLTCHVRFDLHGGDYCLWAAEESVIFPRALWGNLGGTRQARTPHLARLDQALISKKHRWILRIILSYFLVCLEKWMLLFPTILVFPKESMSLSKNTQYVLQKCLVCVLQRCIF